MNVATIVQHLATFPMSGRRGRVRGTRELVVANSPFIVAYGIEKERIVILAIYHGVQQRPEVL
jgi:toxin ParE1/3/4